MLHNSKEIQGKPKTASTKSKVLCMMSFFASTASAAKLPYCSPAEGVNYIFNTSSTIYDFLLSRRILKALSTCGLEPGIAHSDYGLEQSGRDDKLNRLTK